MTHSKNAHISLKISGMTCASCVGRVEKSLKKNPNVITANVNLATETAQIELIDNADLSAVIQSVERTGFEVDKSNTVKLKISGMTCASCVSRIENALLKLSEVQNAQVNLATEIATVDLYTQFDTEKLIKTIERKGFEASILVEEKIEFTNHATEAKQLKIDFFIALILSLPIFIMEMGSHLFEPFHHFLHSLISQQFNWYIQFILASVIILIPGRRFFSKGLKALLNGHPDMNFLVSIGSGAAYLYSAVATFFPNWLPQNAVHVYFEPATLIISLILLGRYLEAKAKSRTTSAIQHLIGLQPKTARVLLEDQSTQELPIKDVKLGMIIEIRPGEKIPVDGKVTHGETYVNESMISGESLPVKKTVEDSVIGGTLNENGFIQIRATAVGENAVLARIVQLVENAQSKKLPIQSLIDRITLWFVPAILMIAVLTFIVWWIFGPEPSLTYALINAVAVLIIACPCAMGLATPTSIMVATGRGAELGILFKNAEALQKLKDVKAIAFDKTGTLTVGKPQITDIEILEKFDKTKILQLVASVEYRSEHPIAKAILDYANEQNIQILTVQNFKNLTGYGVEAFVGNDFVQLGSIDLVKELKLDISAVEQQLQHLTQSAKTPIFIMVNHEFVGLVAIADVIKNDAVEMIQALNQQKLHVIMMTGDNHGTAKAVADHLGVSNVFSQLKPHEKLEQIQLLQQKYGKVAFVGDGVNDAPALAQADIGIAIGSGTDVAIETADVVLMSEKLIGVQRAVNLSHKTLQNIHQNLFWAFIYNAALIPVAAGILYPFFGILLSPVLAAIAMALSSVFVLTNALRLKSFDLDIS